MTRCWSHRRYTSSLLLYVSGNTVTQSIMKRYHYLYKTITCQTRPADVRLSIRVAATKHMSSFFSPTTHPESVLQLPSSQLQGASGLMTTPLICYFISLNIGPQLLSHTSLQQEELVKYKRPAKAPDQEKGFPKVRGPMLHY